MGYVQAKLIELPSLRGMKEVGMRLLSPHRRAPRDLCKEQIERTARQSKARYPAAVRVIDWESSAPTTNVRPATFHRGIGALFRFLGFHRAAGHDCAEQFHRERHGADLSVDGGKLHPAIAGYDISRYERECDCSRSEYHATDPAENSLDLRGRLDARAAAISGEWRLG